MVVLVKIPLISPLPLAAIPVTETVLSLVQLKVVPVTFPESTIVVIALAEQIVCTEFVATPFGIRLTINSDDVVSVLHPLFTTQL